MSEIKEGDWIRIGKGMQGRDAVICRVKSDASAEVVYLDRDRSINEDVEWKNDHWDFKNPGPCGGYADNSDRLKQFVQILRQGRTPRIS